MHCFPCRQIKTQGASDFWVFSPPTAAVVDEWKSFELNIQMKCTCVPVSIRYAHHIAIICHPRRWVVVTETFTMKMQQQHRMSIGSCEILLLFQLVTRFCFLLFSISTVLFWHHACTNSILCNVFRIASKIIHKHLHLFFSLSLSLCTKSTRCFGQCALFFTLMGKKHRKREKRMCLIHFGTDLIACVAAIVVVEMHRIFHKVQHFKMCSLQREKNGIEKIS